MALKSAKINQFVEPLVESILTTTLTPESFP